jgi:DNA polymerase alpha subunit B
MLDKKEVELMRAIPKTNAPAATNTLAKSLVTPTPAPASAPVVTVKKEGGEDKMEDAAAAAAGAATQPAASTDAAAATASPVATAASAQPDTAAATASSSSSAAQPIVVRDDEDEDEAAANEVPLVPVGASKSQSSVLLSGRVVYDPNDALSEGTSNELVQRLSATHSVWLEGDKSLSGGARIQMRLNGLPTYALFPGQVVLAKGINASGMSFVAEEVFTDASLPHASLARDHVERLNASLGFRPLGLMVAAGPFTTSDDLSFAPLFTLLSEVVRLRPDVLLLQGPFLDVEHPLLADNYSTVSDAFSTLFARMLNDVMACLRGMRIKVLVQPSPRDVAALAIFPQPAFDLRSMTGAVSSEVLREHADGRLVLLPNPAQFRLNDVTVGASTVDVLSHLGAQNEVHKAPPAPKLGAKAADLPQGRLQRLASHLISSHSFYPLFPAPEGVCLDYSQASTLRMNSTPDILILPSKMRHFASPVRVENARAAAVAAAAASAAASSMSDDATNGSSTAAQSSSSTTAPLPTVVVNPEYLTKGPSGGTYALVSIHPLKDEEMVPPPGAQGRLRDHCILSRTRVDIIRI